MAPSPKKSITEHFLAAVGPEKEIEFHRIRFGAGGARWTTAVPLANGQTIAVRFSRAPRRNPTAELLLSPRNVPVTDEEKCTRILHDLTEDKFTRFHPTDGENALKKGDRALETFLEMMALVDRFKPHPGTPHDYRSKWDEFVRPFSSRYSRKLDAKA